MFIRMKKILFFALMLLTATSLFTACEDDRDSNPTLIDAKEIVLNTPPYATAVYDLQNSKEMHLTWSQPQVTDKNAPLAGRGFYAIQISKDGNFTTSTTQADADKSGATVADYIQLDETFSTCNVDLFAYNVNKALVKLYQWEEGKVPATTTVYLRVIGSFTGDNPSAAPGVTVLSNVVKLTVAPFYIELRDAAPELWYFVGEEIADGSWSNSPGNVGVGSLPMFPIEGYEYDKVTGKGVVTYTGFFTAGKGFKILPSSFKWEYAYIADGVGKAKNRDGGADGGNIEVSSTGYYTITVDNIKNTCEIKAAEGIAATPKVYTSMGLCGINGDWNNDVPMSPVNTKGVNHLWVCDLTVTANTTAKFRAEQDWNVGNWGKELFPYGKAISGGSDIQIKKGTYKVFFNDLTGEYYFIQQ